MKINIILFVPLFVICEGADPDYEKEITMSASDRSALEQFKALVIPKIPESSQIKKYLTDDLYFIRWLRASNMNVAAAENMFINHLKWRENGGMDTIEKDTEGLEVEFPTFNDGVDKYGQPVAEMWFGEWPVRQAALTGKGRQIAKLLLKTFELQSRRLYDGRQQGKEIGSAIMILRLEGFSLSQQGCPACLPLYIGPLTSLESNYPQLYSKVIYTDMPQTFHIVLNFVKPILSKHTRDSLMSFTSREQWMKLLDEFVPKDQRSVQLGGTVKRAGYD